MTVERRSPKSGTARSLTPETRDLVEKRVREVVEGTAKLYGAKATVTYKRDYPVTRNHERQTAFAAEVASQVVGKDRVDTATPPVMGAEDHPRNAVSTSFTQYDVPTGITSSLKL